MVCLHSLKSEAAERLSLSVISGVWQTSFEVAKALVEEGEAAKAPPRPTPTLTPTLTLTQTLTLTLTLPQPQP